jgi:UDP-N-acetylmuramate: L-alanyl-gamma-D-glutamyl-meso-diaminopimelate ligase
MEPMEPSDIRAGFDREDIEVGTTRGDLDRFLAEASSAGNSLLMMSSGTFGGVNLESLAENYLDKEL